MLARLQRGPRPGHAPAGAAACAAARCRCTAASCSTSARCPASSTSTTTSLVVDVLAGHLRRLLRGTSCRPSHGLTVGHWPQSIDAVDRRRLAGLPRRRPVLDPLRQDRGHGRRPRGRARRRPRRSAPAARPRRRSAPTSPSCSSAPRARSASSPAPGCGLHPAPPHERAPRTASPRFADGPRRVPPHPAPRRHAGGAAPVRRGRGEAQLRDAATVERAARARRGRPARSSTRRWRSSPRSARRGASRSTHDLVDHWMEHRNDVAALEALICRGFVVDTMEIAGPWARAAGDLRRDAVAAMRPCRARSPRSATSRTATRRRVPLLHLRRQGRARRARTRTTALRGTPGTRAVLGRRRRAQPPPRRRPQPRPLRAPRRSAPAFDVLAAVKARARPERHPQPRQARPPDPFGAGRWPGRYVDHRLGVVGPRRRGCSRCCAVPRGVRQRCSSSTTDSSNWRAFVLLA